MSKSVSKLNALTIDVEEHFQVHAFAKWIDPEDWGNQPSRVVENTQKLLRVLASFDVRATFFIVGWVADRFPSLVQEIADSGHEIGSHSYLHQLIYDQTPSQFEEDLDRSLHAISRAVPNVAVVGYRAPSFSMTQRTVWAQDILLKYGFHYDSSIFPLTFHDRYGMRDAERFAYRLDCGLWEFPMSTVRIGGRNLPVAGGGYFRLYPFWLTRQAIRRINQEGHPANVYLHPWEVDPDQPIVAQATGLTRFRHYVNISQVESRLRKLLQIVDFAPLEVVFANELACLDLPHSSVHRHENYESTYENRHRHSGRSILPAPGTGETVPETKKKPRMRNRTAGI